MPAWRVGVGELSDRCVVAFPDAPFQAFASAGERLESPTSPFYVP